MLWFKNGPSKLASDKWVLKFSLIYQLFSTLSAHKMSIDWPNIRKLLNLIVFPPTVDTFNAYKANFCQFSLPPIWYLLKKNKQIKKQTATRIKI